MLSPVGSSDASRFSRITDSDHAGLLWIVTILCIIYSTLSCLLRAYIKRGIYGWDDLLMVAATAVHLGQSVSVFSGLLNGLAKFNSLTEEHDCVASGKAFLASELLSILALSLSKCSVLAMMLRLWTIEANVEGWRACFGILILSVLWGVGSMVGLAVNCDVSTILTRDNTQLCPSQYARWQTITAMDMTIDTIIFLLPVALTWSLNMPANQKFQVALAFGFRLVVLPASALHLFYFKDYPTSAEPQFVIVNTLLLQQSALALSLVSASIPNLKAFMKSFHSGLGLPGVVENSNNDFEAYELQTIGGTLPRHCKRGTAIPSSRERQGKGLPADMHHDRLGPDPVQHRTAISHTDSISVTTDGHSFTSNGSQKMMIRKKVGRTA